jgi:hypothetical protein
MFILIQYLTPFIIDNYKKSPQFDQAIIIFTTFGINLNPNIKSHVCTRNLYQPP